MVRLRDAYTWAVRHRNGREGQDVPCCLEEATQAALQLKVSDRARSLGTGSWTTWHPPMTPLTGTRVVFCEEPIALMAGSGGRC